MNNEIVIKTLNGYFIENNLQKTDVASALGVSKAYFCSVMKGRYRVTKKLAMGLSELYGFSVDWLLTGMGNVFQADNENKREPDYDMLKKKNLQQEYEIKVLKDSLEEYKNKLLEVYERYGLVTPELD